MEREYRLAYDQLNAEQRAAVDTIDGPVLVLAGPGTGKTQLLTTRVAHILATTDTQPHNILCLTFSDSAAHTMRDRLINLIGKAAYDVTISTYHSFGSNLIRRYPEYFSSTYGSKPVDDLTTDSIFRDIVNSLPYSNPLKFADNYIGDIKEFVSDAKKAYLTPTDIKKLSVSNQKFIDSCQPLVNKTLGGLKRVSKQAVPKFKELYNELGKAKIKSKNDDYIINLSGLMSEDLEKSLDDYNVTGKTTPLSEWKNRWLVKNEANQFVLDGTGANKKLTAAADIFEQYLARLQALRLFDYDDMIIRAISGLEANPGLRNTLQEQYQYILLDEFQDTNRSQLKLIELLTDNPVHEGRPNIMAVGDDDQAIYSFQGAHYSHMLHFQKHYRNVDIIALNRNYRSHPKILHLSDGIVNQISDRLINYFGSVDKKLLPDKRTSGVKPLVERWEAKSDVSQFAWIADKILGLSKKQGVALSQIAVLAPQHKYLEPLVAFLHQKNLPVSYEKRENILEDEAIKQLIGTTKLCLNLNSRQQGVANELWSEVLSYDFWKIPTSRLWELSWKANDNRLSWTKILMEDPELQPIALFFIRLNILAKSQPIEIMLDFLVGVEPLIINSKSDETYQSPFYDYYFGKKAQTKNTGTFWQLLTNLTILREKLNDYYSEDSSHLLKDLLAFVDRHNEANIRILNTSPYHESDEAVQLMTAYKAKGQEFEAVFMVSSNDETWGSRSRTQSSRLPLPPNLSFIRYRGVTDDERLRLMFVAITRAKTQLYLVNYTNSYSGKQTTHLKFLDESEQDRTWLSPLLPKSSTKIRSIDNKKVEPTKELATYWQYRHQSALTSSDLKTLIKDRLAYYQLSPTHLNNFTDLSYAGPQYFLLHTLLRFPIAPTPSVQFGNAMHETLQWIHITNRQKGRPPSLKETLAEFKLLLSKNHLSQQELKNLLVRGHSSLKVYLEQRKQTISIDNESEYNFRGESVFLGDAHLGGKIDKLVIDKKSKQITIVDFKTGRSYKRWEHNIKLHKYRQQLYLYKYLVENSRSYQGYRVTDAYIEFIEPDDKGEITELHIAFDVKEMNRVDKLLRSIWKHIQTLDMPDTSQYGDNLSSVMKFEDDLVSGKI